MAAVAVLPYRSLLRPRHAEFAFGSGLQRRLCSNSLPPATAPPLILLLDLDETLIRPKIQKVHAARTLAKTDFRIVIDNAGQKIDCAISLRPGIREFFDWIRTRRASGHIAGPWIFGQGAGNYVRPVLRAIDPKKEIFGDRILVKESCTPLSKPWPWVLKSFSAVPAEGIEAISSADAEKLSPSDYPRVVLADNNVMSCILHPENTLLIRDWLGNGAEDNELARVTSLLDRVIAADHADGSKGDYAKQLVKETPRFDEYKQRLADLNQKMQQPPDPEEPLKKVFIAAWEEACNAKRMLLGLGPKEV